jgi:hypothetical protein
MKASLEASAILSYITSCKLGEASAWHGPTASFVLHWQNQVRLYENQVNIEEYFSNGQKKNMLQNAVHPVQELCAVKTQADHHKTQTGKDLTYDQYVNLLLSAASTYDAQFAPKTHFAARAPRRAVYSHDFTTSNGDDDPGYDIDCALDVIQANGHSTRPPGTSMALTQWTKLSQDAKDIWDTLTDEAKGIILDRQRDSARPPGRGPPRPPFRNTNLHDISAIILANIHDICTENEGAVANSLEAQSASSGTPANDATPAASEDTPTTLLANATKHHNVSPADLCRVLSSTMTWYPATTEEVK